MKKTVRLAIFIVLLFLIGVLLTLFTYINYRMVEYHEIETSVKVVPGMVAGFNLNTSTLVFGKVSQGGGATRYINLTTPYPSRVYLRTRGSMANMIYFTENNIVLEPGVTRTVPITLAVPSDTPVGNYTGVIRVFFLNR